MSKINVNTWEPESSTAMTMGASGDTTTVPSGASLVVASGATINITGATQTGFPSAGFIGYTVYTGDATWLKSTNSPTKVIVEVQGGGAGGGYSGVADYAIGGSGGGYARKFIDVSSVTQAVVTVGAAGTAAGTSSVAGGDGGDSSWVDTASGGSSTVTGVKGVGLYSSLGRSTGGAATGGDINIDGGPGDNSSSQAGSCKPGDSFLGVAGINGAAGAIKASSGYGAGGPGGHSVTSLAGMPGVVIVWEFA